ncbi:hypothetical protein GCM10009037_24000 [Halarchaeum grantii]|uniref:Uncharacterized protein n=1 Tax=Halarchaeum grantii TaxID=1193105 RepID=A0A830F4H6_9EURY|nr:hypothetical protein [Halarchaeum grantii]GGL39431.1 hypothetical protein GCM10009037_24000 [Halarchaeum grantii]
MTDGNDARDVAPLDVAPELHGDITAAGERAAAGATGDASVGGGGHE